MGIFKHPDPYTRELSGQSYVKPFNNIQELLKHYSKNFKKAINLIQLVELDNRIEEIVKDDIKLDKKIIKCYNELKTKYLQAKELTYQIELENNILYNNQPEIILAYSNGKTYGLNQTEYKKKMEKFEKDIKDYIVDIDKKLNTIIFELNDILSKYNNLKITMEVEINEAYKHTQKYKQYLINMLKDELMYINGEISILKTKTMQEKYVMDMTYKEIYNKIKNKEMLLFAMIKDTPIFIENYKVRVPYNLMGYFIGEKGKKISKIKKHFRLQIRIEKDERWEVNKLDVEYVIYNLILKKEKHDNIIEKIIKLEIEKSEIERKINDIMNIK